MGSPGIGVGGWRHVVRGVCVNIGESRDDRR